jgi:hypothetical protein
MHGVYVDDVAAKVPAGELVPFDTRVRQGIVLASPTDAQAWMTEFADQIPKRQHSLRNPANPCGYFMEAAALETRARERAMHRPRPCPRCTQSSTDIQGGLCLLCREVASRGPT